MTALCAVAVVVAGVVAAADHSHVTIVVWTVSNSRQGSISYVHHVTGIDSRQVGGGLAELDILCQ